MQYLSHDEYLRLVNVARANNPRHALAISTGYAFGLRVSELLNVTHAHVVDGQIDIARLKGSLRTLQPICEALRGDLALAAQTPGRLFPWSRQWFHELIKRYAAV